MLFITGQFAAVPLNLIKKTGKAIYLNTGIWSAKAAKEATKYGTIKEIKPNLCELNSQKDLSKMLMDNCEEYSYFYYCANETVQGVELPFIPETCGLPIGNENIFFLYIVLINTMNCLFIFISCRFILEFSN